jgi:hypothetical protein
MSEAPTGCDRMSTIKALKDLCAIQARRRRSDEKRRRSLRSTASLVAGLALCAVILSACGSNSASSSGGSGHEPGPTVPASTLKYLQAPEANVPYYSPADACSSLLVDYYSSLEPGGSASDAVLTNNTYATDRGSLITALREDGDPPPQTSALFTDVYNGYLEFVNLESFSSQTPQAIRKLMYHYAVNLCQAEDANQQFHHEVQQVFFNERDATCYPLYEYEGAPQSTAFSASC